MKYLILLIFMVLCTISCAEDPLTYVPGIMETDDIEGTWYETTSIPLQNNPTYYRTDTTLWFINKTGPLHMDSLEVTREYHRSDEPYDPLKNGQTQTFLGYTSGQGSNTLCYGSVTFKMPSYDSLIINWNGEIHRTKRR